MVRPKKKKPKKKWKIQDVILFSLAVVFSASIIFAGFSYVFNPPKPPPEPPSLFAAIIDPLSVDFPNQTFIDEAETLLENSGYTVDVYSWELVTVDFYRILPALNYDLIIIRSPQCWFEDQPGRDYGIPIFLVTAEEFDQDKYVILQGNDQVVPVQPWVNGTVYFAASPDFVLDVMQGQFQGTVIIIAGSFGLFDNSLAIEMFDKGAIAIVSWKGGIITPYMDSAIVLLLNNLFVEKITLEDAVEDTNNTLGTFGGTLGFYPYSAREIRFIL